MSKTVITAHLKPKVFIKHFSSKPEVLTTKVHTQFKKGTEFVIFPQKSAPYMMIAGRVISCKKTAELPGKVFEYELIIGRLSFEVLTVIKENGGTK